MLRIRHRYMLRERETKKMFKKLMKEYPKIYEAIVNKKSRIEHIVTDDETEIEIIDKKPILIKFKGEVTIPTINILNEVSDEIPKVIVDQGAIPYIINGADIMRPGIVNIEGKFDKGAIVQIQEERFHKVISIGMALYASNEIIEKKKGKVVRNIHHVGDKLWDLIKKATTSNE